MTQLMHAWPSLTVAAVAIAAAVSLVATGRSWRPTTEVHALQRGTVDPTALLHLRPGPGSIATLAATPERDIVAIGERIATEERERARVAAERAEADAFFADFRGAIDAALTHFRIETEHLQRKAKGWHLQCGTDCPECFTRTEEGGLVLRPFRVDEPTGEYPLVIGVARVPAAA